METPVKSQPLRERSRERPPSNSPQAPGGEAWTRALRDLPEDLPYKVETNARGQLVLTRHKIYHSDFQGVLIRLLASEEGPAAGGHASPEYAVHTAEGVKVPDVIWISTERARQIPSDAEASPVVPEICIEVLSDSNTEAEMEAKRGLFFEGGAEEVWIVGRGGELRFFDPTGEREQSALAPTFPERIV